MKSMLIMLLLQIKITTMIDDLLGVISIYAAGKMRIVLYKQKCDLRKIVKSRVKLRVLVAKSSVETKLVLQKKNISKLLVSCYVVILIVLNTKYFFHIPFYIICHFSIISFIDSCKLYNTICD